MKNMKSVLLLFLPVVFITACGTTTQITSSWKASDVTHQPFKKIAVLAMIPDKNRMMRDEIETDMAAQLKASGHQAVSVLQELGPQNIDPKNEKQVMQLLQQKGIDAVITVSCINKENFKTYNPGSTTYMPGGVTYNPFWNYYSYWYDRIYTPGYFTSGTNYVLETNLYEIPKNQLLYSVQSKTFDPATFDNLGVSLSKTIVTDLTKSGILH